MCVVYCDDPCLCHCTNNAIVNYLDSFEEGKARTEMNKRNAMKDIAAQREVLFHFVGMALSHVHISLKKRKYHPAVAFHFKFTSN